MRWNRIRPYVGFKVKPKSGLTAYQKRKIRHYYNEIEKLDGLSRPVFVYRGKIGSKRLKGAQEYAQHPTGLSQLRVAFIPHPSGTRPVLSFSKSGRLVSVGDNSGVRRRIYLFSDFGTTRDLFENPERICAKIKKADKGRSTTWRVLNGEWEIGYFSGSIKAVPDELRELIAKYSADNIAPIFQKGKWMARGENHHAENWLIGLAGYSFFNQGDMAEYEKARGLRRKKKKFNKKKFKGKEDV